MKESTFLTSVRLGVIGAVALCAMQSSAVYATTASSNGIRFDRLTIGELLGNSTTREIVVRYIPEFRSSRIPQSMRHDPLKAIQAVDPRVTHEVLSEIYAALAKIPVSSAAADLSPPPPDGPTNIPDSELDPARHLMPSQLESVLHKPLPEQYIWTSENKSGRYSLRPHYFRRTFHVSQLPPHATLYLAGPRQARIYINGREVGHYQLNPDLVNIELVTMGIRVYHFNVTHALRVGRNVVAIEAVRGPMGHNEALSPVSKHLQDGKLLAMMIVPAARGIQARPLVMSDGTWRGSVEAVPEGWEKPDFDDSVWKRVDDLGGIESAIGLFQGNADAGMYAWPGYQGISPFLAQFPLEAVDVRRVFAGIGTIKHVGALTGNARDGLFTVTLPATHVRRDDAPQVMLDFGREVSGRIEFVSDSSAPAEVTVQYGESAAEAILQPFLGVDPIYIPPHGTAYGPKSGFRYVLIRFTGGRSTVFRAIRLAGIGYPVRYKGFFKSSSPLLNRMWTIGAYTAHLCMQSGIWDGVKRDRNRWAGDLDVSGRTIDDVFGTRVLMQSTLNKLIGPAPVDNHVNGIPGYSAFWVNELFNYYLHTGSKSELDAVHSRLVELLTYMEKDLDRRALFSDLTHGWPFVDWSPGMYRYDRQTRMATQFEYYQAFKDGSYLLNVLHDQRNARRMAAEANALKAAAQKYMVGADGTFGTRWQPNAYAVLSGVATKQQYSAIWRRVLSHVGEKKYSSYVITPYYNFYVVSAMARMDHRHAALKWIRQYWGGMVNEGATSFWEGYNPTWLKGFLYQQNLQADASWGFHVSLAHGWASGVTPWLMAQVLGIRPTAGGFAKVTIRPDLLGLKWAKGGEPTPHGILQVSIRRRRKDGYITTVDLPADEVARVSVPVRGPGAIVLVNSHPMRAISTERGKREVVTLSGHGKYVITSK